MSFRSFCNIEALNKNGIMLIAFGIILFLGIDLRFYNLNKVYTEYDDIGVLALHKGVMSDREGEVDFWFFKKTFSFTKETLQNLEKTYLFPFYIAWGWTYSPGQYVLYPLILSNTDDYETKVFKGRFFSVLSSVTTILVLFWLFATLNNGLNWAVLFSLSLFTFSQNSILYAHHMSPYSTYCLSTALGLVLLYLVSEKKISTYAGCLLNSILMYFSYMNILLFIPLLYFEFHKNNLKEFVFSYFSNKKHYLLANVLLLFPVLVILKMKMVHYNGNAGMRGVGITQGDGWLSTIRVPVQVLKQIFMATQSLFTGFFPVGFPLLFGLFFLFVFVGVAYLAFSKSQVSNKIFFTGLVLYSFQWIALYMFSKVPLDQTRHALILFPVFLAMAFACLNYFKLPNLFYVILCLIAVPYSYVEAINLSDRKGNNLNFEFIEQQSADHIFTYDSTLSPALYFEGKKTVINVDMNSFIVIYKNYKMPEAFLLVSQHTSLDSYRPILQKRFPEIFTEYKSEILAEKTTGQYFTYNNYPPNSTQNGFYVYRFHRVSSAPLAAGKKVTGGNKF